MNPDKITNSERVPTSFEAKWFDAAGVPDSQGFRNIPNRKR